MYLIQTRKFSYITIISSKLILVHHNHLILRHYSSFNNCPSNVLSSKRIQFKKYILHLIVKCLYSPSLELFLFPFLQFWSVHANYIVEWPQTEGFWSFFTITFMLYIFGKIIIEGTWLYFVLLLKMFILIIWIPSGITLFTMLTLWHSTPDHSSTRTPSSPCSGSSFGPPIQVDDLLSPLRLWLYMFGSGSKFPCWAVSRMDSLLFLFKLWHPTLGFPLYKHLSHPAYALICHVGLSLNMVAPLTLLERCSNPLWLFPLLQSPLCGTYLALFHIMAWGLNHFEREEQKERGSGVEVLSFLSILVTLKGMTW